ncbi:FAD:protein FMN transferase [Aliiglaciecola sp. LCG003]|uniref:FAD:protein FMN transferase n=1 Tax=Aliiglaciecola sp. LCG003 TaxID=3053655 RepID=UPI002572F981|nr:FAD:protein FMN transferase [Aliiglaciecola sp. LCG003]WJG09269.1 FAD:protein FMN transferase [Aliiglaciecola sp. LCG003]
MSLSPQVSIEPKGDHISGRFRSMASLCEILVDSQDIHLATELCQTAFVEAKRIENKFSRYQQHNLMAGINNSKGRSIKIDDETYKLLTFADTCYQLSDGMFDITSGVLRKAWRFDQSDKLPSKQQITELLPFIGWPQVKFDAEKITLPIGFELDFGGIGKEYAVNSVAQQCQQIAKDVSVLVNFGGDIQVTRPRAKHAYWQVGIEDPSQSSKDTVVVNIAAGGLATSGDANRFLLKDGIRYGHILNPKTGYPIMQGPRSVTVAAPQCIQSGLLATLALLHGHNAEAFLEQQDVTYWCFW